MMTEAEEKICTEFLEQHPNFFNGLVQLIAKERNKGMVIGGVAGIFGTALGALTTFFIDEKKNSKKK